MSRGSALRLSVDLNPSPNTLLELVSVVFFYSPDWKQSLQWPFPPPCLFHPFLLILISTMLSRGPVTYMSAKPREEISGEWALRYAFVMSSFSGLFIGLRSFTWNENLVRPGRCRPAAAAEILETVTSRTTSCQLSLFFSGRDEK